MKKILLLSALFGGFVLNNGYCYDENHKIQGKHINNTNSESSLKSFVKDLLNSTIEGKRVVDLLYQKKFNISMLKKICDDSMRGTTLSVSNNVIIFDTPITTSYRVLYNIIKITLNTGKLSDNVLINRLDEDGDPKFSTYVTVLPSGGIGEAFGDATTLETNRLQQNQFKKGIKAVKQQKQTIMQKMKSLWSNKKM